jgi:AcrR family transcriptional regulator
MAAKTKAAGRPAADASTVHRSRGRRSGEETRQEILDIALELFVERGYEATSLRAIAGRLGTTKAALYYYFERKEDIFLELHLRLHRLGNEFFDRLEALPGGAGRLAAWPGLLDDLIGEVLENRQLILLHQRNRAALEAVSEDVDSADAEGRELLLRNRAENEELEQRLKRLMADPDIPLAGRVRMVCSIGVVITGLLGSGGLFTDVPIEELARLVGDAARDTLG